MVLTTLGYIRKSNCYLMLHRIKKKNDINHDKWIGIGGKVENGETILEGMLRETREETGLEWKDPSLRGIVTFNFREHADDPLFCEQMFLYTGSEFEGRLKECDEGQLEWVDYARFTEMPLWEGDYLFLDLMRQDIPLFYLQLEYLKDELIRAVLDGQPVDLAAWRANRTW